MTKPSGPPFWLVLVGHFLRGAFLVGVRYFTVIWYCYFALKNAERFHGALPMYLSMLLLSLFGLWKLFDYLTKFVRGGYHKPQGGPIN